jgi:hypothetical protein
MGSHTPCSIAIASRCARKTDTWLPSSSIHRRAFVRSSTLDLSSSCISENVGETCDLDRSVHGRNAAPRTVSKKRVPRSIRRRHVMNFAQQRWKR